MNETIRIDLLDGKENIYRIISRCADSFFDQSFHNDKQILLLAEKYHKQGKFCYAIYNGNICGFAAFYCNDFENHMGFLSIITVKKDFQGLGVGKLLLEECIRICRQAGMNSLRLEVNRENKWAIDFYNRMGFIQAGKNDVNLLLELNIKE